MTVELLTVDEAAQELNLSASWLNKLRLKGEGPSFIRLGRLVRYTREDLEAWIESGREEVVDEG